MRALRPPVASGALLLAALAAAASAAEPWPEAHRRAFVDGCAQSMLAKALRGREARGEQALEAPARDKLEAALRETCVCSQLRIASRVSYAEFLAEPGGAGALTADEIRTCAPKF